MVIYILLALLVLSLLFWAIYDHCYHGKSRPLWPGLFLAALGGFLGLLAVPALRARAGWQAILINLPTSLYSFFGEHYGLKPIPLMTTWFILDRLAALQAVLWLWRNDPERYRMDADALRAWSAAAEAGKSARSGPEEGLAARGAKAADHQTGL